MIPEDVARLLGRSKLALKNLNAMAPSYRKHFVYFIDSAKRPETRERRAQIAIELLEQNITLDLNNKSKIEAAKRKVARRASGL